MILERMARMVRIPGSDMVPDVHAFIDPTQALAWCETNEADLILVDYIMQDPALDGIAFVRRMRSLRLHAETPVIMITGADAESKIETTETGTALPTNLIEALFAAGAQDFIRKPVNETVFRARVQNSLAMTSLVQRLRHMATTDELTGVLNRRAFLERCQAEMSRTVRYGHPLSLVMIDADHFKKVNDTYGHAGGDEVLRHLARLGRRQLRPSDHLGRLGGEEFAMLLPETTLEGAATVADRLRESTSEHKIPWEGREIRFTLSLGVSCWKSPESVESLLNRADQALYRAKAEGRDRVVSDQ